MSTFTNTAREVEMPNGDVVVIHNAPTGGENTTSNIKKFKYDDNGHVTESTDADAEDLNLSGYSTPTTGSTDIGTSDDVQTAIGKLDHQSQIDQTNIWYTLNKVGKNLIPLENAILTNNGVTVTLENSVATVNGKSNSGTTAVILSVFTLPAGTYKLSGGSDAATHDNTFFLRLGKAENDSYLAHSSSDTPVTEFTLASETSVKLTLSLSATVGTVSGVRFYPMVCDKKIFDQDSTFQPYGAPNYDLTRLQVEDRAALVECVDEGAKNLLDLANVTNTDNNVTVSKSNSGFTITSTDQYAFHALMLTMQAGVYYLSADISALSGSNNCSVYVRKDNVSGDYVGYQRILENGKIAIRFTVDQTRTIVISFYASDRTYVDTTTYTVSNLMICTKAKYDISPNHEPFALPNTDLTQEVNALHERTDQIQPVVKFDADVPGWYRVFTLGSTHSVAAVGAYDNSCDIIIKRLFANNNNEHHEIKLASIFESMKFIDECSKSNVLLINNIRYVSTSNSAYIDIYYSGSAMNTMVCSVNNNAGESPWKAVNTVSRVPETTTGETVWASYAFRDNYLSPNDPVYIDTGSLNDLTENKLYYAGANVTDKPTSDWGFVRNTKFDSNTGMQEFVSLGTSSDAYIRTKVSGTWQAWKQITNA